MKILIIGASRGIGLQLVHQALMAGHTVTAMARHPENISAANETDLRRFTGDITNGNQVAQAIEGQDAVCLTIGVPITFRQVSLFSKGTAQVLAAMQQHDVKRLLCVTGIGAGESRGHGGFLYDKLVQPLLLKTIYADKDRQEKLIKASDRDWLIIRPAGLTNRPRSGSYKVLTDLTGVTAGWISRADVADFMLQELVKHNFSRKAVLLTG